MKLILIRHATTPWNLEYRIQGLTDTELHETGREEAKKVAGELSRLGGISEIVSSDLKRARQTSEIINEKLNVPLVFDQRLRECAFGSLEGLTRDEMVAKHGEEIMSCWDKECVTYDFRNFGGENSDDVRLRHLAVLKDFSLRPANGIILVVGHGRSLGTLLAALGHSPLLQRGQYQVVEY